MGARRGDEAEEELTRARAANADAAPETGLEAAARAFLLAVEAGVPAIAIRAGVAAAEASAYLDRLPLAMRWAGRAQSHATTGERHGSDHMRALGMLFETWEMRGALDAAAFGFMWLEGVLPAKRGWATDLRAYTCNHLLSLAGKLGDPFLGEIGVAGGMKVLDLVGEDDEASALLQWSGIYSLKLRQAELARELLEESHRLRARTLKRDITKHFPDAHLLAVEGRTDEALTTLDDGIALAGEHDLLRYVRSGRELRRLIVEGEL